MNGRPLGPGGYGGLELLEESRDLRYLVNATKETAAPTGMTRCESIFGSSNMGRKAS